MAPPGSLTPSSSSSSSSSSSPLIVNATSSQKEIPPARTVGEELSISVIVPVHNGGEGFLACAAAVAEELGPQDELIVVADGETDGVWRLLPPGQARVLVNDEPHGPATARNRGARAASGDVLFFVDADVIPAEGTLARVRQSFADDPALDALIGSYDDAPGHPAFLSQYRNLLHHYTHQTSDGVVSTFWGACGAVRREAFREAGGFDERYRRPSVEDIELGYRMTASGRHIRLDKNLQVKHLKEWTAQSVLRTDLFSRAIPWTELLLRNQAMENNLNVSVVGRLSTAAVCALPLAVLAAPRAPRAAAAVTAGLVGSVLALNAPFYRFLRRERGVRFALRAVPWHLLYFGISGMGFALGIAKYATFKVTRASAFS